MEDENNKNEKNDKESKNAVVKVILLGIIVILIMIIAISIYFVCVNFIENEKVENNVSNDNIGIIDVTKENFQTEVKNSEKPVLVCFEADWCKDCQNMKPIVEEVAKEISTFVKICRVNTDEQNELKTMYGIKFIPTFILFENGQEVSRKVGNVSKEVLIQMVNEK